MSQCKSVCAEYYSDCLQPDSSGTFHSHTCIQPCSYITTQTTSISTQESIVSTGKGDIILSDTHRQIDSENVKLTVVIASIFAGIVLFLLAVILVFYCIRKQFRNSKNTRKDTTVEVELTEIAKSSNCDVSKVEKPQPATEVSIETTEVLDYTEVSQAEERKCCTDNTTDCGNESCLSSPSIYIQEQQAEVSIEESVSLLSRNNELRVVVEEMTKPIQERPPTYYEGSEILEQPVLNSISVAKKPQDQELHKISTCRCTQECSVTGSPYSEEYEETTLKSVAAVRCRTDESDYKDDETPLKTLQCTQNNISNAIVTETTFDIIHPVDNTGDDKNEDVCETIYKRPLKDIADIPNADLRTDDKLPGKPVSSYHSENNEERQYAGTYLEYSQASLERNYEKDHHLLSIVDTLIPANIQDAQTRLGKFEVTDVLDKVDWVRQYMLDQDRIEVYVDFDNYRHLTYLQIIEILKKLTLWDEMDFRIREMLSSEYEQFAGPTEVSPGIELSVKNWNGQERLIVVGMFLYCAEYNKYYAITAGHCISNGDKCYKAGKLFGTCVLSQTILSPPKSVDIAFIEVLSNYQINNFVHSAVGEECGFKFPQTDHEICDMECWKVQRKSRESWQYGFLRYACITNKNHGLYRVVAVVRTAPDIPVINKGDCGCLVTSLPRNGELTVYGIFVGRLTQVSDDGAEEPVEWYIACSIKDALNEIVTNTELFGGKSFEVVHSADKVVT